jgi:hypothetical protein
MLRNLQQLNDAGEPCPARQLRSDIGERDFVQLRHLDLPGRQRVATADAYMRALPEPHGARDFACANAISERAEELHVPAAYRIAYRLRGAAATLKTDPSISTRQAAHGFAVTVNTPPSLRPFTAGLYISSACTGGRTNTPGVVARATYDIVYVPGHSVVAT